MWKNHIIRLYVIVMYENELLQDIINGINDNYDMSGSISQWIDEDIFFFFF